MEEDQVVRRGEENSIRVRRSLLPSQSWLCVLLNRIFASVPSQWIHLAFYWLFQLVNYVLLIFNLYEGPGYQAIVGWIFLALFTLAILLFFNFWLSEVVEYLDDIEAEILEEFPLEYLIRLDWAMVTLVVCCLTILFVTCEGFALTAKLSRESIPVSYIEKWSIAFLVEIFIHSCYFVYYTVVVWQDDIEKISRFRDGRIERGQFIEEEIAGQNPEEARTPIVRSPPHYSSIAAADQSGARRPGPIMENSPPHYSQLNF